MSLTTCAYCGKKKEKGRMIRRRLNGADRYCCSIACEVAWEKMNLIGVCG